MARRFSRSAASAGACSRGSIATSTRSPAVSTAASPNWAISWRRTSSGNQRPGGSARGGGGRRGSAPSGQDDGLLHLAVVVLARDEMVGEHAIEHVGLPLLGPLGVPARIDAGGILRQAGEDGRLPQIDILDVLVEVVERGLLHAVMRPAEVDLVQVEEEDVVLGEIVLQARGEQDFF